MTRRRHWNGPAMRMFRWWNRSGDTGVSPALLGLPGNADGPPAALERPGDRGGLHGGFGVTCLQKNGCCMAGNCRWAEAGTGTYGPRYHTQTSRANRVVENNRAVMRKPRCCAQTAPPRKTALPRANRVVARKPCCRGHIFVRLRSGTGCCAAGRQSAIDANYRTAARKSRCCAQIVLPRTIIQSLQTRCCGQIALPRAYICAAALRNRLLRGGAAVSGGRWAA